MELLLPSNNRSVIRGIDLVGIECSETNLLSIKQCEDPESIKAQKKKSVRKLEAKGIIKESEERADTLSFNSVGARWRSTQLPVHAESPELRSIFLNCPELWTMLP